MSARAFALAGTVLIVVLVASPCCAAQSPQTDSSRLVTLASSKFPNLTRAERALLEFSDKSNLGRGEFAVAGTSAAPLDPSNDPVRADDWSAQRNVRAELIRWMCVDRAATDLVDPRGLRVLGARIVGPVNLQQVRVPFAIALRSSSIQDAMNLREAEIPSLDLRGSYSRAIDAQSVTVPHAMDLGENFHAHGVVNLDSSTLGAFYAINGHFEYQPGSGSYVEKYRPALVLTFSSIKGAVFLTGGFEARGNVMLYQARIGGDLDCSSGHFSNPEGLSIEAWGADVAGGVFLSSIEVEREEGAKGGPFQAEGLVNFLSARVGTDFTVNQARFAGNSGSPSGLNASLATVKGLFSWQDVSLSNGAELDLRGASLNQILAQEQSWPSPGNLALDGLTYSGVVFLEPMPSLSAKADAGLRSLALQPLGYHPQPYRQLARVLRESGDDAGATRVMIASGDARYSQYGILGRSIGWLLKVTIAYGHRPLLAILWSVMVVAIGWGVTRVAKNAGVMRQTWPENTPPPPASPNENLQPFLYSIDVFVPFVNLHQEHYWWPDANAIGRAEFLGIPFECRGWMVRSYLWAQIIAGWLLSAIFIAGITGLLRND